MYMTSTFTRFVGRLMRSQFLVGIGLACWLSSMSAYGQWLTPAPAPKAVNVTDRNGIDVAMKQGKFEDLRDIASQNLAPETHEYALAAYYRSIFDLRDSDTHLEKCLTIGRNMLDRNPVPVLLCGRMLAGNNYIRGDIRKWATTAANTRDAVTPVITQMVKTSNFVLPGISDVPLENYLQVPQMSPPPPSGKTVVIPRQGIAPEKSASLNAKAEDGVLQAKQFYVIGLQINDALVPVIFDTGASSTTLGEFTAKAAHIKDDALSFISVDNPFNGQNVQSHLGVVSTLIPGGRGFDDIRFRNFPLVISPDVKISAAGIDLFSKLGSLMIENTQIVIHPRSPPQCEEQLHVTSEPLGSVGILLNYVIDGKMEEILLDTGDNGFLSATASASVKGMSGPLSASRATFQEIEKVQYETTEVTIGMGQHARKVLIRYYPDRKAAAPYVMGLAALEDFDVFLDFDHGKACLIPH
jgi:hypothetical protein